MVPSSAKYVGSVDPGAPSRTADPERHCRARASLFLRLLATALLLTASGCALQLTGGWSSTSTKLHLVPRVVAFEARAFKPRHDGPLFGLAVQAGLGESGANPVRIRTGLLAGGYHFRTAKRFP